MSIHVALISFALIFIAELPDKTMFANLVMATRGRPLSVWIGSAVAFAVHVAIATIVGVALFAALPHRVVEGVVAALFAFGAVYAWLDGTHDETGAVERERARHSIATTAFVVIFLAEWGDLTQLLTANLAARYHQALSVAVGAMAALLAVAGIAVAGGQALLRVVRVMTIRRVTAIVLVGLAAWSLYEAIR